jgi:hypothetical protein
VDSQVPKLLIEGEGVRIRTHTSTPLHPRMRASLQRRSRRVREGFVSLWMLRSSFRIK